MADSGHIELERSVDSIQVGVRHRKDLGDLQPLIASIDKLGLLQPITITPDGLLLCGRRRLEAIRHLNWKTVKVWVRAGLSDQLNSLLAQQDDNVLHKPLSVIEAAALYKELKQVISEDAARRQKATRFGADHEGEDGGGDSPPPWPTGKTRERAANAVTGNAGYKRLEQVNAIETLANDEAQPDAVRGLAQDALGSINGGAAVYPWFNELTRVRDDAQEAASDDELDRLAQEALERIKKPKRTRRSCAPPRKRSTRAFVHTWTDMDGWSNKYDACEVASTLTDDEWALFERVVEETNRFHENACRVRDAKVAS